MTTHLDLKQLAIDRGTPPPSRAPRRRHLVTRYLVPAVVLLGFLAMLGWAARDHLLPSRPVTVVPVVVTRAEVRQSGAPLFKAPGWVEPRPAQVLVSALAEGVVEELLVVEGQEVKANQPVARLIDTDARIALEQAKADLQLKEAELAGTQADLTAAQLRFQQPVHLEAELAEADSSLAKAETELARLPFQLRAAEARLHFARQELKRRQAAGDAVAGRVVEQAQSELDRTTADVEQLQQRGPRLQREVDALRKRRAALEKQLELKIDESRQLTQAEAQVKAAEARRRQAQLAVDTAQLQLERMVVRAPVAGRVLDLIARPGTRTRGLVSGSQYDAGTMVSLYDPEMLQVRADVRLEDVPLLQPGQPVWIETASVSGPMEGEVLFSTSLANIQKNTLEVKVAVTSPPPTIRPEMLVQVTFLAPEMPASQLEESERQERLLIPRQLVEQTSEGTFVWVADPGNFARRQPVKMGFAGTDLLVEVVDGLNTTDKLISSGREGLRENERIKIAGEDPILGMNGVGTSGGAD